MGKFKTEGTGRYHLANSSADAWLPCTTENLIMWICSSYFSVSAYLYQETPKVLGAFGFSCFWLPTQSIIMAVAAPWGDSQLHRQFFWYVIHRPVVPALAQTDSSQAVQIDVKCCHQWLCVLAFCLKLLQTEAGWLCGFMLCCLLQNSIVVWIHPWYFGVAS